MEKHQLHLKMLNGQSYKLYKITAHFHLNFSIKIIHQLYLLANQMLHRISEREL